MHLMVLAGLSLRDLPGLLWVVSRQVNPTIFVLTQVEMEWLGRAEAAADLCTVRLINNKTKTILVRQILTS